MEKYKSPDLLTDQGFQFVGTTGFEPATPSTPCLYATGLRYVPNFNWLAKLRINCFTEKSKQQLSSLINEYFTTAGPDY